LICGEEPELCARIRRRGGRILRLDHDMTLHDAAMQHFRQWWLRSERAGHAYAEGAAIDGWGRRERNARAVASALVWGLALPGAVGAALVALVGGATLAGLMALLLLLAVAAVQLRRVLAEAGQRTSVRADALRYALFTLLAKMPQAFGVVSYLWHRVRGARRRVIEYDRA